MDPQYSPLPNKLVGQWGRPPACGGLVGRLSTIT